MNLQNTPEPAPQPSAPHDVRQSAHWLVCADLMDRAALGQQKYGVPLMVDNGRDHLADWYQEMLDGLCYARMALGQQRKNAAAIAMIEAMPATAPLSDAELAAECAARGWGVIRPTVGPEAPKRPSDEEEPALPDGSSDLSPSPDIDEEALEAAFWLFDEEEKRTGAIRDAFKGEFRLLIRQHLAYFQRRLCEAETYVRAYATQFEAPEGRPGARRLLAQLMCTPEMPAPLPLEEMATYLSHAGWVVASPDAPFPEPLWRRIGVREGYGMPGLPATSSVTAFDFLGYLAAQRDWSTKTFGPGGRTKGIVAHIRKELEEILAAPDEVEQLEEWIDVLILACDGAWRTGATLDDIIEALARKAMTNQARTWPDWRTLSQDQPSEHVRALVELDDGSLAELHSLAPGKAQPDEWAIPTMAPVLQAEEEERALPSPPTTTVLQHCLACELEKPPGFAWSHAYVVGRLGELGIPTAALWSDHRCEVERREPRWWVIEDKKGTHTTESR